MDHKLTKEFLDQKVEQYRTLEFIQDDPIQIPRSFDSPQDMEISGLVTSLISWGQRKSIIQNAQYIMQLMDNHPYDFVRSYTKGDLATDKKSLHRTFMSEDLDYFLVRLRILYEQEDSLEAYFKPEKGESNLMPAIDRFRDAFLDTEHRSHKHVSSPAKGSAAKRLHMFLRWMVRKDHIDLGVWNSISTSQLSLPLDVHTARVARKLGLLERQSNDRYAVEEVDEKLAKFDPTDPVKYDFALFGLGVYEGFGKEKK